MPARRLAGLLAVLALALLPALAQADPERPPPPGPPDPSPRLAPSTDADPLAAALALVAGCERAWDLESASFTCDELMAAVMDGEESQLTVENLQALVQASLGNEPDADLSVLDERFPMHDGAWPGVRITLHHRRKPLRAAGFFAMSPGAPARIAMCVARADQGHEVERCEQLLPLLARLGPRPFQAAVKVRGRAILPPAGCELATQDADRFQLRCGTAVTAGYARVRDAEAARSALDRIASGYQGDHPELRGPLPWDCRLLGVPTACQLLKAQGESVVFGTAVVDGEQVVVHCFQERSPTRAHPACEQLITF